MFVLLQRHCAVLASILQLFYAVLQQFLKTGDQSIRNVQSLSSNTNEPSNVNNNKNCNIKTYIKFHEVMSCTNHLSYHNTQTSSAFTKTFRSLRSTLQNIHAPTAYCITQQTCLSRCNVHSIGQCACIISCDTNMSGDHIAEPACNIARGVAGIES